MKRIKSLENGNFAFFVNVFIKMKSKKKGSGNRRRTLRRPHDLGTWPTSSSCVMPSSTSAPLHVSLRSSSLCVDIHICISLVSFQRCTEINPLLFLPFPFPHYRLTQSPKVIIPPPLRQTAHVISHDRLSKLQKCPAIF